MKLNLKQLLIIEKFLNKKTKRCDNTFSHVSQPCEKCELRREPTKILIKIGQEIIKLNNIEHKKWLLTPAGKDYTKLIIK